ncbi:hypothetical protein [Krasilnikovia sp. MM14-A1004]|uniref:hypothetical protein n=1 Tax=Krasilnikovia sp. MM14-A1004 TaxID=3373541 RepID=UPI00399C9096
MPVPWLVFWSVTELVIMVAAVWSWWSPRAMHVGRFAVATLFLAGGALFNTLHLTTGGDYAGFADASYLPFVTDTWRAVVAPHQHLFISLLIAFEVGVGVLMLSGDRWTRLGLVAAIGFHVGLMFFGWLYYPFSIAMIISFALLLRAERRHAGATAPTALPRQSTPAAPRHAA